MAALCSMPMHKDQWPYSLSNSFTMVRVTKDPDPIPEILGMRQEYTTVDGTTVYKLERYNNTLVKSWSVTIDRNHVHILTHTVAIYLSQYTYCFWEMRGNWRCWRKPTWMQEAYAQKHYTDSNPSTIWPKLCGHLTVIPLSAF